MLDNEKREPACFGVLERVFPLGTDGLRQTPAACLDCSRKIDCLRAAVAGREGYRLRSEVTDRAYRGGMISFFERWSKRKYFQRKLKKPVR